MHPSSRRGEPRRRRRPNVWKLPSGQLRALGSLALLNPVGAFGGTPAKHLSLSLKNSHGAPSLPNTRCLNVTEGPVYQPAWGEALRLTTRAATAPLPLPGPPIGPVLSLQATQIQLQSIGNRSATLPPGKVWLTLADACASGPGCLWVFWKRQMRGRRGPTTTNWD